jgi:hypothetical protein
VAEAGKVVGGAEADMATAANRGDSGKFGDLSDGFGKVRCGEDQVIEHTRILVPRTAVMG